MKQAKTIVKERNWANFLIKNQHLSEPSIEKKQYGYDLINKYVDLDAKIKEFKLLEDPDGEMEELLQEWINHLVKNPTKNKPLSTQSIKQYANAVNSYISYQRFRVQVKQLQFPKELKEERYALSREEILQIFKDIPWIKQAYYLCLISTAARPREILGLSKNDLEWVGDKWKAKIPAELTKKRISRTIFFSKECNPYLNSIMKKPGSALFEHNKNLRRAVSNEGNVFRSYLKKIGLDEKYPTTGFGKINLYCFRGYFFTKALDLLKDDIAHAMLGHGAYLQQYQRRTDAQKKQIWDEVEPEILIFDESKKDKKIKDLEIAVLQNQDLTKRIEELEMKEAMIFSLYNKDNLEQQDLKVGETRLIKKVVKFVDEEKADRMEDLYCNNK